jgi:hypothetical protein
MIYLIMKNCKVLSRETSHLVIFINTHTHTHTQIYNHIYMGYILVSAEAETREVCECESYMLKRIILFT